MFEQPISQELVRNYIDKGVPANPSETLVLVEARRMLNQAEQVLALQRVLSGGEGDVQRALAPRSVAGEFTSVFGQKPKKSIPTQAPAEAATPKPPLSGEPGEFTKLFQTSIVDTQSQAQVVSWRNLILSEVHEALCQRKAKYKEEVAALQRNGNLLIAAIAGYVAASVNVAVAVIAALVAAILRLAVTMGVSVFCEWTKTQLTAKP
jgi:hypothetical protein